MFQSKRRSRPVSNGPLPGNQSQNVDSNALAAASAIGFALKTGTPIPRSNSLQRTSSLQRASFQKSGGFSRSSSILGLQTAPEQFLKSDRPAQANVHARAQSLTTAPKYRPSNSSLNSKPRTIKKYVPGPYGLVTIEVPVEETQSAPLKSSKPKKHLKKSPSFTKPNITHSETSSLKSFSSSGSKRPYFEDQLKEVREDEETQFTAPTSTNTIVEEVAVAPEEKLDLIKEDEEVEAFKEPVVSDEAKLTEDLEDLQESKNIDELELSRNLEEELKIEQQGITNEHYQLAAEISKSDTNQSKDTVYSEGDILSQYTENPSTVKSSDTLGAAQSSNTTQDTEVDIEPEEKGHSSMAQQLRSTIPSLVINHTRPTNQSDTAPETQLNSFLKPTSSNEEPTANSSIYSDDPTDHSDGDIPSRSNKREHNPSTPKKSALKNKSSSSISLINGSKNPANEAYLSLTTAENTRLNALSFKNNSSSNVNNRPQQDQKSSRQPVRSNQIDGIKRPQQHQLSRPPPLTQGNGSRPQSSVDSVPQPKYQIQRPQSAQGTRQQQTIPPNHIKQPAPTLRTNRPQQHQQQHQQFHSQPQSQNSIPRSASNAAALSAVIKKNEPPKPKATRSSSFEKERSNESNAAFKRKSLRDPSFSPHNIEFNLAYYRNQSQRQSKVASTPAPAPPQELNHQTSNGFRSRFNNDSDSEIDVPAPNHFANGPTVAHATHGLDPPPSNPSLRKPRSQFTLRTPSVNTVPENSPAKSLPEKRNTRYFSEADKEQLFNQHLKKAEVQEKKKNPFGKLKKLFGRSKE